MPASTRNTRTQSNNSQAASSSPTSSPVRATARKSVASQSQRTGQNSQTGGGSTSSTAPTRRRAMIMDSDSEGSDADKDPPASSTTRNSQPVASTSTARALSVSPTPSSSKRAKLDSSQSFFGGSPLKSSPSKQGGPLKKLTSMCVSYILVADRKKYPIRKADILKNVFASEQANAKECYTQVLIEANKVLKKTFGFELLQLQNQKNSYILINVLDPDHGIREFAEYSEEESQKRGLIFLLLTIIFMNENYIAEDKLWKALGALGIYPNLSTSHPVFGKVKQYITTELVREMYLEHTRVSKDPVQYEFRWGERAYQEVKKKDLLEFACNMIGDCNPQDWKLQFRDANPNEA